MLIEELFCRGMKQRDLLLHRYWRRDDDGTYGINVIKDISIIKLCSRCLLLDILCLVCDNVLCHFPQTSNNLLTSLPEDLANCSKLTKPDLEVLLRSLLIYFYLLTTSNFLFILLLANSDLCTWTQNGNYL